MNKEVNNFIKSLNNLAPLKYNNYKMPYKPAIVLAIFKTFYDNNDYEVFNKWIDFSIYNKANIGTKIIQKYYDIITSISDVFDLLKQYGDKKMMQNIQIGFNEKTFKSIRFHLFDLPLTKLSKTNTFLEVDKTNKRIRFNYSDQNEYEIINTIINKAYESLKKCNDFYNKLELDQILNYDSYQEFEYQNSGDKKFSTVEIRQYQHWFAKRVKDRDTKCIICCEDYPGLLEAAHIMPFSECSYLEKYDDLNGITLCKTHHQLFDEGYFTFNDDWTISLSKSNIFKLYKTDLDLKFKQYESCLDTLKISRPTIDVLRTTKHYLKYHQEYIFKK